MSAKFVRYVVCEGPDGLAALRALTRDIDPDVTSPRSSKHARELEFKSSTTIVRFEAARGAKSDLARAVMDISEGGALKSTPVARLPETLLKE